LISSAQIQANFLRIVKSAFYHALKQLYSVLRIPSSSDASTHSITLYHASFGDFLRDKTRSGEFYIEAAAVHYDVAINALRWHINSIEKQLKGDSCPRFVLTTWLNYFFQDITWVSSCEDRQTCLETLKSRSLSVMWKACTGIEGENASILVEELQSFDFNILDTQIPSEWKFPEFLMWLNSMVRSWSDLCSELFHIHY
jgi:hypothetical protein